MSEGYELSYPDGASFVYGPAKVTRLCSDKKWGVWIEVSGKRGCVTVRVTPSGLVRVGPLKKERGNTIP